MSKRLVCICNFVTEREIIEGLKKGAQSTSEIQKQTRAGTNCGRCLLEIDSLVEEFLNNLPGDPQQKLDFKD
jgi:bacterioferritin-associated ferredoxin